MGRGCPGNSEELCGTQSSGLVDKVVFDQRLDSILDIFPA